MMLQIKFQGSMSCFCLFEGCDYVVVVVVDSLFIVAPIVKVCNCSMFCCTLLYVHSCFAIILMVALFGLSSCCLVVVVWLFLMVPWVCCGIS